MTPLRADMFDEICPSTLVPLRMGDKWAPLVIRCLEDGPRRFSELRVPIRASAKVLTTSLRRLERDGFVSRRAEGRSVDYALTPLGRSLAGQLESWCRWTEANWDELLDARDPV
ncbi:winged helix-turn-helix transcriptional regulator [Nocardioides nitrophenolicus]|uniref:winged helix-turn-helix transcriptional regulator n=1 Tax=Nocardioides nitrophenolicus TaxID=60489 RepID=UPI00195CC923|nr:helix-turn-helix domain-containing protein [Nocardioides nitrophenolicus]MBM7518828.1 DNA-binding HxlR family transcriptional regulator [Nocardioides nitrophenolicus]